MGLTEQLFYTSRCMENKRRRADGLGCENCPPCYNLVQDAVNQYRKELTELNDVSEHEDYLN